MVRLIPKDEAFFDLFLRAGDNLLAAAHELESLIADFPEHLEEHVARIQALEHEGDVVDDEFGIRLERAFITPFDREDIHELISRLDDIVDGIQSVAETFVIYGIESVTPEARRMSAIIAGQAALLLEALQHLEKPAGIAAKLSAVHDLEHEADGLSRAAIGRLFHDRMDPLEVIKLRDLYTELEESIDAAEDAAEVLERIIHKGT
jgi:predicted phosphate transport protein (TIGR00153 family)